MELLRRSFFADYFFACRLAAADIRGCGGAPRAFIRENRFGADVKAGVVSVSNPGGPCDSAVGRLGVSLAPVGVWAGWSRRFRVMGRHLRSLCYHVAAILPVFAAAGQPLPPRFWGIGAD